MFSKKRLSAQTMTGLKANLQILPWYEISYHVVRNGKSEHPKIKCIILIKAAQKTSKICSIQKLYTHLDDPFALYKEYSVRFCNHGSHDKSDETVTTMKKPLIKIKKISSKTYSTKYYVLLTSVYLYFEQPPHLACLLVLSYL